MKIRYIDSYIININLRLFRIRYSEYTELIHKDIIIQNIVPGMVTNPYGNDMHYTSE